MGELILYVIKSVVYNTIFLSIYLLLLKKHTFFSFNRYFLLVGLLLSALLPLYTYTHQVTLIVSEVPPPKTVLAKNLKDSFFLPPVLLLGYVMGLVFFVGRYLFGLVKIRRIIRRCGFTQFADYRLVRDEDLSSSFSAFNYIFINTSAEFSQTDRQLILAHEVAHVRQCHWADLFVSQLFCTLQWFNPFAWKYQKAIRENHEYLADQAVLRQGAALAVYSAVLVNQCIGSQVFSFSSYFHQYHMPRLNMLSRPGSPSINKALVLFAVPAIGLFVIVFSQTLVTIKTNPGKAITGITSQVQPPRDNLQIAEKSTGKRVYRPKKRSTRHEPPVPREAGPPPPPVEASVLANPPKTGNIAPLPPLILLDGLETRYEDIDQGTIGEVRALKDQEAIKAFGARGKNGVMLFYTKDNSKLPK